MRISTYVRFKGGPVPPGSPDENPNPGGEVVEHLVACLPRLGIGVRDTTDVEYAHEVRCIVRERLYTVTVAYDWVTRGWWEVFYAPRLSWVSRLLGRSEEEELRSLTLALAAALECLPGVGEMRWYDAYGVSPGADYRVRPST